MKVLLSIESLKAGGKERQLVQFLGRASQIKGIHFYLFLMNNCIDYKEIHDYPVRLFVYEKKGRYDFLPFVRYFCLCW